MDEGNTRNTGVNAEALEPPRDIEAERAVLGSMMLDADAVADVIDRLHADDFYLQEHQEIYTMFLEMYRKSVRIDLMTARTNLNQGHLLEAVGGVAYLGHLTTSAIVPANAKYYADAVAMKSRLRQLIREADKIRQSAYDGREDAEQILDRAEQGIFEIAHRAQRRSYTAINEVLQTNILEIRELERNKGQLPGITTGFKDLDRKLDGFHKTDLVILAARPGMGKTSMALNIAENAAMAGHSVLVFSMEMAKEQLGQRMLSMSARVDMSHIKRGEISEEEWISISEAQDAFDQAKIAIDDSSEISILEMKNKCRRRKAEAGLDLVIIDYLQLMSLGYSVDNRTNEISAITRNIKTLAKELDVCVVLLSQLSRESEKRSNHRPQLSDLRDSGAIEQDADVVIFLLREDYYADEDEPASVTGGDCEVIIAKHRNGEVGSVHLAWIPRYTKFGNLEYRG